MTQKRHFGTHVHCTTSQYPCEIRISRSSSLVQGHVSKKSHEHNLIHTFATATGNLAKSCDAVKHEVIKASLFNTFVTHSIYNALSYALVACEIKLFQNYFSLRRRLSEIILFQHLETCLELFQNYFTGLLQLMDVFKIGY